MSAREQERTETIHKLCKRLNFGESILHVICAAYDAGGQAREAECEGLRRALVAAVPFLCEHGRHVNEGCYRGSDDICECGLDEAIELAESALSGKRDK